VCVTRYTPFVFNGPKSTQQRNRISKFMMNCYIYIYIYIYIYQRQRTVNYNQISVTGDSVVCLETAALTSLLNIVK
jgi:hypothetical protein